MNNIWRISIILLLLTIGGMTNTWAQGWSQIGQDIFSQNSGDMAGTSVAMNGDGTIIAFGEPMNSDAGTSSGQVRVYQFSGGMWSQMGSDLNGIAPGDEFGCATALSADGTTLAIGARYAAGATSSSGEAYVYQWNGSAWMQQGSALLGDAFGDQFGASIDLSADGSIVAVGAPFNTGAASSYGGHAKVYENLSGTWVQVGSDIDGVVDNSHFGFSIALNHDGHTVAIGSPRADSPSITDHGEVYVYSFGGSAWAQQGGVIQGGSGESCGWSISLDSTGNRLAIGYVKLVPNQFVPSAFARVFDYSTGNWNMVGNTISATVYYDRTGHDVSLSNDGTVVNVSSPYLNAGLVRSFRDISGSWTQIGGQVDGLASGDKWGWSIAASEDGQTFVAGAPENDSTGLIGGHMSVYTCRSKSILFIQACDSYTSPSGKYFFGSPGTYNFIDTIPNHVGCDSIMDIDVVVNASSGMAMMDTACMSYTSPSGNHMWTSSGVYFDTLINTVGCDSILQISLTVDTVDTQVSLSGITLSVVAFADSYQWIDCSTNQPIPGATDQFYQATSNGNYAVIITNNGCSDTSDCLPVTEVGVPGIAISSFNIYPNPSSGQFTLMWSDDLIVAKTIEVLDAAGKRVHTTGSGNLTSPVALDVQLPPGYYLIRLNHANGVITHRMVIR